MSRDVRFYENIFPFKHSNPADVLQQVSPHVKHPPSWLDDYLQTLISEQCSSDQSMPSSPSSVANPSSPVPVQQSSPHDLSSLPAVEQPPLPLSHSLPVRRSTGTTKAPKWLHDFIAQASGPQVDHSPAATYPMTSYVSLAHLSSSHKAFLSVLDTIQTLPPSLRL